MKINKKQKIRKINKKWHKDTINAILNADAPGEIKFNQKTGIFEVLNKNKN